MPPASDSKDPRFRNELPQGDSLRGFLSSYSGLVEKALSQVPARELEAAFKAVADALKRGARVYVAGNGGSAAIGEHLCCDWMKGTAVPGEPSLMVRSLTSETALFTALANDFGYDEVFSRQIHMLCVPGDILVLISSSGNSPNIVKAVEAARAKKMTVIGLTGFSGGALAKGADISLHVPANNYGIAEDAHQMIMHALAQFLAKDRDARA